MLRTFYKIKDNRINFDVVLKRQNEFLNKLSNIKIGKKSDKKKEVINNLNKFYHSREEVINFFRDYIEMLSDANYDARKIKQKEQDLKY